MKKLFIVLIVFFALISVNAQGCLPEGIIFATQIQIDNFQMDYPGCSLIEGDVVITGGWNENIENFNGLANLTAINGSLEIISCPGISNLSGLENIVSIGGNLIIGKYQSGNASLQDLTGLENLTSIGGGLFIEDNEDLNNLNGLNNLISIDSIFYFRLNNDLVSLSGLDNLSSVGSDIYISSNLNLCNLSSLGNLNNIGGNIEITNNHALTDINGLENISPSSINNLIIYNNNNLSNCTIQSICEYLKSPGGSIDIYSNAEGCNHPYEIATNCGNVLDCLPFGNYYFFTQDEIDNFQTNYPNCNEIKGNIKIYGTAFISSDITNLEGLNNVNSISGNFHLFNNDSLHNFAGMEELDSIGGGFSISTSGINNFQGLENLISIGGGFGVGLEHIDNFLGMENLTSIGGGFTINGCGSLDSLSGLENLQSIGSDFTILTNYNLKTIKELYNLRSIEGYIHLLWNYDLTSLTGLDNIAANSIKGIYIEYNYSLSKCNVQSICDYLTDNWGLFDHNSPGCNSKDEVELACLVGTDNYKIVNVLNLFPNPATDQLNIESETEMQEISLVNAYGQAVLSKLIQDKQAILNISGLQAGIYIVRVKTEKGTVNKRVVVNK